MNKEKELECLKIFNKKKLFNKNIVFKENERPDFVSKDKTIGIEHFLVDVLEGSKKKGSLSRKQDNSIEEKIKNYKNAPDDYHYLWYIINEIIRVRSPHNLKTARLFYG